MTNEALSKRLQRCTAPKIWRAMDPENRLKAATALWEPGFAKPEEMAGAMMAIAAARRSRVQSVQQAPKQKRAEYLSKILAPPEGVASCLLYAYHLAHKTDMMGHFLDALEIQHENGKITDEFEVPDGEKLDQGVGSLLEAFDRKDVVTYVGTLISQDLETWEGLVEVLEKRNLD
jgi:hypothetical protein